jgi:hypothetical protein
MYILLKINRMPETNINLQFASNTVSLVEVQYAYWNRQIYLKHTTFLTIYSDLVGLINNRCSELMQTFKYC